MAGFDFEAKLIGADGILPELRDEGIAKRTLHQGVGKALRAACEVWINRFLPLHFQPSARGRYGHRMRATSYQEKKTRYATVALDIRYARGTKNLSMRVANPNYGLNPPTDWVYTGELRSFVLGRAASGQMLASVTTPQAADRLQARIKIPYPHPVHPNYSAAAGGQELVRATPSEWAMMSRAATKVFMDWVRTIRGKQTFTRKAA